MADLTPLQDFEIVLDFAFGIADRGIPLSLVLIQPDDWPDGEIPEDKRVALERLALDVAERTRRSDRVTQVEKSRFAALLVDCNRQGALIFADRLQAGASAFTEMSGCSVSCGIATFGWGMSATSDLFTAAAGALERALARGGGTIEIYDGPDGGK